MRMCSSIVGKRGLGGYWSSYKNAVEKGIMMFRYHVVAIKTNSNEYASKKELVKILLDFRETS